MLLAVPTDAGVDFDGFGGHFGVHFESNFVSDFQAIILLIVGCDFESMLINFDVYFGVFWSKSVVCHETCEIVKNLCFT
jgi:hypothetical protein